MPSYTLYRVLCVEDDDDACEMLCLLLKPHGVEVIGARSVAEARLKMKHERFDLYLLDGWLPELSGFEFCSQIREADSITPIVFYSGAAYDTDKRTGIAAGANAYVVKPDIKGLIETTLSLIKSARADRLAVTRTSTQPAIERQVSTHTQLFVVSAAIH